MALWHVAFTHCLLICKCTLDLSSKNDFKMNVFLNVRHRFFGKCKAFMHLYVRNLMLRFHHAYAPTCYGLTLASRLEFWSISRVGPPQMAENTGVTGVITPINGVITVLKTGKGPPCSIYEWSLDYQPKVDRWLILVVYFLLESVWKIYDTDEFSLQHMHRTISTTINMLNHHQHLEPPSTWITNIDATSMNHVIPDPWICRRAQIDELGCGHLGALVCFK